MTDDLDFYVEEGEKPYNIGHRCFFFAKGVIFFVSGNKYERAFASVFYQLVRSATSVGANVVEGKSGRTKKRLEKFLCDCFEIS